MMKLHLIYLTLLCLSDAAFVSHMGLMNHNHNGNQVNNNRVRASAFRPGVMLRPWTHPRLVQAASHRVPYVIYRNQPQRYAVKHYSGGRVFTGPWKAARPGAAPASAEYEFVRAASASAHAASGAIHTIPAPNLSLSEKPIVVMDDHVFHHNIVTESPKITYEVTEKYLDHFSNSVPRIEKPIGFSKATSFTAPELHSLVKNGLQLSSDLGISSIALPSSLQQQIHHHIQQQQAAANQQNRLQQQQHQNTLLQQQNALLQQQQQQQQNTVFQHQQQQNHQQQTQHQQNFVPHGIVPQQFSLQNLHNIQNNQEIVQAVPEGLVITPNALYQPDPAFLEKLQNQLLQRFPGVEFVPYAADLQPVQSQSIQSQVPAIHLQQVPQSQQPQSVQPLQHHQPQSSPLFLLQNEQIVKQDPPTFGLAENQNHKNVFLRETHEGNVVTLVPQVTVTNATDHQFEVTSASTPQNVTLELVHAESKPEATTVKYIIETTTEQLKTTPVFYTVSESSPNPNEDPKARENIADAQIDQSTGNVVTDSFYSGVNDIRAQAALLAQQVEKSEESTSTQENTTTTTLVPVSSSTINADLKQYFVQQPEVKENKTAEIKPLLGVPFAKAPNSVAYTLVRSDDKETKVAKDGSVYAGQLVEASVSEDSDFNKEKAHLLNRRAPLRLMAVTRNKEPTTTTSAPAAPQKVTIVKARIPPKSKLTFDDKTGEPVLRIYASYVDNSAQKEATASKLANIKHAKEVVTRQQDTADKWRRPTVNALAKPHGFEPTQVTQFGLKLRSRSDSFSPLFDDYMV